VTGEELDRRTREVVRLLGVRGPMTPVAVIATLEERGLTASEAISVLAHGIARQMLARGDTRAFIRSRVPSRAPARD